MKINQWNYAGLRRRSAAARLLRLWVRIPPGALTFFCYECCVMSRRGLCDELITRPEVSYRLWCVVVYDLDTSWVRRPWPTGGLSRQKQTQKTQWNYVTCITVGHEMQRFQCNVYALFPSKPSGNDIFRKVLKYISTFCSHTATVFVYSVHLWQKQTSLAYMILNYCYK
jgi:hypothetical protein